MRAYNKAGNRIGGHQQTVTVNVTVTSNFTVIVTSTYTATLAAAVVAWGRGPGWLTKPAITFAVIKRKSLSM